MTHSRRASKLGARTGRQGWWSGQTMPFETLVPGSVIGILGGGQLGRFLAISAAKLGLKAFIYADEADSPAFQAAWRHSHGSYTDEAKLAAFAKECGCVTFEFE